MIKIGTKKELYKISHLPIHIQNSINEDVKILDEYYGTERDIDADMGGFVIICDKNEPLNIKDFEKEFSLPEYIKEICPYKKSLYISGSERNIVIYEKL